MGEELKPEVPVKPGYKTTEFWLSAVAMVCGILMSSGFIADGTPAAKIVGGVLSALAVLGYSAARAKAKV